jgi:hypothetical protein
VSSQDTLRANPRESNKVNQVNAAEIVEPDYQSADEYAEWLLRTEKYTPDHKSHNLARAYESLRTEASSVKPGTGPWLDIRAVDLGTKVIAPNNKGTGYHVGVVKMDPYGSGVRVVSDGESFVTPKAVQKHCHLSVVPDAQPADAVREALRQFALEVIKARCWFSDDSLDGGDLQDLAEKLGLIEPYVVSAEDHEEGRWGDYDVGDIIFVPSPSLAASQPKAGDVSQVPQELDGLNLVCTHETREVFLSGRSIPHKPSACTGCASCFCHGGAR